MLLGDEPTRAQVAWTRKFNDLKAFVDQKGKQPSQMGDAAERSLYYWKYYQLRRSDLTPTQQAALLQLEPPKRSETSLETPAPKRSALALGEPSQTDVTRTKLNKLNASIDTSSGQNDESKAIAKANSAD